MGIRLIAICMLYLFRSFRILFCSLIPNIIPLVVTAGIMGWAGVPLKPSTVLIFSVALGIAIDITIRFPVNYRQDLPVYKHDVEATVGSNGKTGLSIIYTAVILTAGFIIFAAAGSGTFTGMAHVCYFAYIHHHETGIVTGFTSACSTPGAQAGNKPVLFNPQSAK